MKYQGYRNTLAVLITIGILAIMFAALAGCAGKGLRVDVKTTGGSDPTKDVKLSTDYQIENGFKMTRNTITGDYEIELGSATTKDADPAMWQFMNSLLQMMRAIMLPGVPIAAPTPAPATDPE
jgi:hypothetical protein